MLIPHLGLSPINKYRMTIFYGKAQGYRQASEQRADRFATISEINHNYGLAIDPLPEDNLSIAWFVRRMI